MITVFRQLFTQSTSQVPRVEGYKDFPDYIFHPEIEVYDRSNLIGTIDKKVDYKETETGMEYTLTYDPIQVAKLLNGKLPDKAIFNGTDLVFDPVVKRNPLTIPLDVIVTLQGEEDYTYDLQYLIPVQESFGAVVYNINFEDVFDVLKLQLTQQDEFFDKLFFDHKFLDYHISYEWLNHTLIVRIVPPSIELVDVIINGENVGLLGRNIQSFEKIDGKFEFEYEPLDVPSVVTSYQQNIKPYHKLTDFSTENDKIFITTEFNIEHFTNEPMFAGFISYLNSDKEVVTEEILESFFLRNKELLLKEKENLQHFSSLLLQPEDNLEELQVYILDYEKELTDPMGFMFDYLLIDSNDNPELKLTGEIIHGYDLGYLYEFINRALNFVNKELELYDDEGVTI